MSWQDIIITIVIILFSYALIPQVIEGFRKKKGLINLQTSGITALGMFVLTFIYFTLELYFSSVVIFFSGILWTVLFVQRIIYK